MGKVRMEIIITDTQPLSEMSEEDLLKPLEIGEVKVYPYVPRPGETWGDPLHSQNDT